MKLILPGKVNKSGQNCSLENYYMIETMRPDGTVKRSKVKIVIRTDSVVQQSYARAYVIDRKNDSWNLLISIHPNQMRTPHDLACWPNKQYEDTKNFRIDLDYLLYAAEKLLQE